MGYLITQLWDRIVQLWFQMRAWFLRQLEAVVTWLWDTFAVGVWIMIRDFALSLLPQEWVDFLNQRPWQTALDYVEQFNWFFPIYACVAIFFGALVIVALIRSARWILAFIPFGRGA